MPFCALLSCKNHSRKNKKAEGVSFHRFPKVGVQEREEWIKFVQRDRKNATWQPNTYAHICSAHFHDYDKYTSKTGLCFLHKDAIPFDDNNTEPLVVELPAMTPEISYEPRLVSFQHNVLKRTVSTDTIDLVEKKTKIEIEEKFIKWESYKSIVKDLKDKFRFDIQTENDLMCKAEFADFHNTVTLKHKNIPNAALRKFAVSLHFYYPDVYKYVRETYDKAVPDTRTVCRWYSRFNAEPGFTAEIFKLLKQTCDLSKKTLLCSLILNEIAITKEKLFNNDRKLGVINFGAGPADGEDGDIVATHALVFLLVSLNESWKLPLGYFLLSGVHAERKANLINMCLEKCHDARVVVASITVDGSPVNFSMAEILGCKFNDVNNLKTHFPHPVTSEKVCIFIDPSHVVKLIRNAFESRKLMFDQNEDKINWQYVINLNKLQQSDTLEFANILTPQGVYLRDRLMKVKLGTQLFSMNLANTLQICDDVLNSNKFRNSSATVNFITVINNFFKIMNSKKCDLYGIKQPISKENKSDIFSYLNIVKSYVLQLKYEMKLQIKTKKPNQKPQISFKITKKNIVESPYKAGFVGALICIESMTTLYNSLVEEKKAVEQLAMHRTSQDHLELLFGLIRKHSDYNQNPNVLKFRATYKEMLNHLDLGSSFNDNCIPLNDCLILNSASVNVINHTSVLYRHNEETFQVLQPNRTLQSDLEAQRNCEIFSYILDHENVEQGSRLIIGYISGYVSRSLTKNLKCEECIDSLTTTNKLPHHKLINVKDMGGLCYSSKDVYKICCNSETVIRHFKKQNVGKNLSHKYASTKITVDTLKSLIDVEIFPCLVQHAVHQPPLFNHRTQLIRAVVEKYATIRLNHKPQISNTCSRKVTKLILVEKE